MFSRVALAARNLYTFSRVLGVAVATRRTRRRQSLVGRWQRHERLLGRWEQQSIDVDSSICVVVFVLQRSRVPVDVLELEDSESQVAAEVRTFTCAIFILLVVYCVGSTARSLVQYHINLFFAPGCISVFVLQQAEYSFT